MTTEVFRVVEPGPLTTIQDLGRYGYQQFGIPTSGALDQFSCRVANLLVGNPENAATLEMTFLGPRLEVLSGAVMAVTGAAIPLLVNNRPQALWESFTVGRGDLIAFKPALTGVRAYVGVAGGIVVPEVMASRSTCLSGKFGGLDGRALVRADVLSRGHVDRRLPGVSLPELFRPVFVGAHVLRALPGPQDDYFSQGLDVFFTERFRVSSQADRMGYRLEGPAIPFKKNVPTSIITEPSLAGAVQVPPDGQPIILLVEQTAGGYAKIATVLTPDLNVLAQARPGDLIRFRRCDLTQAHEVYSSYWDGLERVRALLKN